MDSNWKWLQRIQYIPKLKSFVRILLQKKSCKFHTHLWPASPRKDPASGITRCWRVYLGNNLSTGFIPWGEWIEKMESEEPRLIYNTAVRQIFLPVLLFLSLQNLYFSSEASQIVERLESLMRGQTSIATYQMHVKSKRFDRRLELEAWSSGQKKSFVRIKAPVREKGITFLKIDRDLWQYIPRIERVMKIPPSMMLQSWMGSDFTNDDMVRESSMAADYEPRLLTGTPADWHLELKAREDSGVVWDKLLLTVPKKYEIPSSIDYYDEDGVLIRRLKHTGFEKLKDRFFPMHWIMESLAGDRSGRITEITVKSIEFDVAIDEQRIFSKHALKKFSR
jgi:hypothetical protein